MNPQYQLADIMIIEDQINLMGDNPLRGINDDRLGLRFPDMSAPYDRGLINLAEQQALALQIRTQTGVFVAVTGPNLETRAEYPYAPTDGCRLCRHVDRTRMHCCQPCFNESAGTVSRDRYLFTPMHWNRSISAIS